MTRKDLQLDQLRRHSIINYLVTDNIDHPCYWSDHVTANEKKKMKKFLVPCSSLKCKKPKAILQTPFSVLVTAVLTAIMRKQFISELERSSFILR